MPGKNDMELLTLAIIMLQLFQMILKLNILNNLLILLYCKLNPLINI
jgi:hypothetical protein